MIRLRGDAPGSTLWIVSRRGVFLALLVLGFATWYQTGPLAAAAALLLALALIVRVWSALAINSVRCTLTFADDRAFPDDEIDLVLRIDSRGPIPIPWLEADLTVPRGLYLMSDGGMGVMSGDGRVLHLLATLMPLQSVERRLKVRCRQRGQYEVPTVSMLISDPLRLYPRRTGFLVDAKLLVYPRIVTLEQIGLRAGLAVGDNRTTAAILPDPTRPVGIRNYRPGDSPRQMHWKASARRGTLQVKVLERTVRRDLALFLDVGSFDHPWLVYREALFERAVTATASLARFAIERGGAVGLAYGGPEPISFPANTGLDQLRAIFEPLAVVQPNEGRPLESMLAATLWRLSAGTTVVILTPSLSDAVLAELQPIQRRGYPIAVVYCGLQQCEPLDGVAWFDLGRDRDVASALAREIPAMTFSVLGMELCIVSLLLGWLWVVVAGSSWPVPFVALLPAVFGLAAGRLIPYSWRRTTWFDAAWWGTVALGVAFFAEVGNVYAPGASSSARWNLLFAAGLLLAWRGWVLAEGWLDRELIEAELQAGTICVLVLVGILAWQVPGAGLLPALGFFACGLFGLGVARRAERRGTVRRAETDWLVLLFGMLVLLMIASAAILIVVLVTPDLLTAMAHQALTVAGLALQGIVGMLGWIGGMFPTFSVPAEPPVTTTGAAPVPTVTPSGPSNIPFPPFWIVEILIIFCGLAFLTYGIRTVLRFMPRRLLVGRAPREKEPGPPISEAPPFSWGGWWRTVLGWLGAWMRGERGISARASKHANGTSHGQAREDRSIRALYREFLTAAERAGFSRTPSTTPAELAHDLIRARPASQSPVADLTDLYVRTRYGQQPAGRDDINRMRTAVQRARGALTQSAREDERE